MATASDMFSRCKDVRSRACAPRSGRITCTRPRKPGVAIPGDMASTDELGSPAPTDTELLSASCIKAHPGWRHFLKPARSGARPATGAVPDQAICTNRRKLAPAGGNLQTSRRKPQGLRRPPTAATGGFDDEHIARVDLHPVAPCTLNNATISSPLQQVFPRCTRPPHRLVPRAVNAGDRTR